MMTEFVASAWSDVLPQHTFFFSIFFSHFESLFCFYFFHIKNLNNKVLWLSTETSIVFLNRGKSWDSKPQFLFITIRKMSGGKRIYVFLNEGKQPALFLSVALSTSFCLSSNTPHQRLPGCVLKSPAVSFTECVSYDGMT